MITLSTQEAHPAKASVRTFVQTLIGTLVLFVPIVPIVVNIILDEFGKAGVEPPAWLYAALTGVAVAASLVSAIVARVMAVPAVNNALTNVKLGAEPKLRFAEGGHVGRPRSPGAGDDPKH